MRVAITIIGSLLLLSLAIKYPHALYEIPLGCLGLVITFYAVHLPIMLCLWVWERLHGRYVSWPS